MEFLTLETISAKNLIKAYRAKSKDISKQQLGNLIKICGGIDQKTNLKLCSLVMMINEEEDEDENIRNNQAYIELCKMTNTPIRENLKKKFIGYQNGITKYEFLRGLSSIVDDKWSIVCLFYGLAIDNRVPFEYLVKIVC